MELKRRGVEELLKRGFWITADHRILIPWQMTTSHLINAINLLDEHWGWRDGWADRLTEELARRWR